MSVPLKRALVLAGGDLEPAGPQASLFEGPWTWVIAADSGARHASGLGVAPTLLVGDFDSISPEVRERWQNIETRSFPRAKDKTDTHLALDIACRQGARAVVVAGGLGSRFDHSLANAHLLVELHRRGVHGVVTDGRQAVYLLAGRLQLEGRNGDTLSVLPLGQDCRGLRIEGLRWELSDHALALGDTLSVSNEFIGKPAILTLEAGTALVIVSPPS